MDVVRFGRGTRALRHRRRWRQLDLAAASGVSRQAVARIEVGRGDTVPLRKLDRVAAALGARTDLRLSWNGEALDRLLDADHARMVEAIAARLRRAGWEIAAEVTFWIRGERGSVDRLAWHPLQRIALVVEVKSIVPDLQAMLAALDRKVRLAVEIARERGWVPLATAKLLVIGESRTSRRRVEANRVILAAEFPDRGLSIRRWIEEPTASKPLRGLMFLSPAHRVSTRHRVQGPARTI